MDQKKSLYKSIAQPQQDVSSGSGLMAWVKGAVAPKAHAQPIDNIPEPDQKNAEAFQRGMKQQPDYMGNLKRALGIGK